MPKRKRQPMSEETKEKIRRAKLGKTHTSETRFKISQSKLATRRETSGDHTG